MRLFVPADHPESSDSTHNIYTRAIGAANPKGLFLEFGVAGGHTLETFYKILVGTTVLTDTTLYGFDSWEGLPEDWRPGVAKGCFAGPIPTDKFGGLHDRGNRVELICGLFQETLEPFLQCHPEPCGFIHIDCDLYSSTKYVLTTLKDRIVTGTIIMFDELLSYPGYEEHEYKALDEFLNEQNREFVYLGWDGERGAVAITT